MPAIPCLPGTRTLAIVLALSVFGLVPNATAEDQRELVELPPMMQEHMLGNMRDHLLAISEILASLGEGNPDMAGQIAEERLGISSLKSHGAKHMAKFMPEGMRKVGKSMHSAASRFALVAQEGDANATQSALSEVTAACVACHAGYRIR